LRKVNRDLCRANEIPNSASAFSRPSPTYTDRSKLLHRGVPRALRGRADLQDPGGVGPRIMTRIKMSQASSRTSAIAVAFLVALGLLILGGIRDASGASGGRWYPIALATGETDEYKWSAGAKVPQHESLDEICAMTSLIEPPEPDSLYAEGTNGVVCGSLAKPVNSVTASSSFGSGDSQMAIFTALSPCCTEGCIPPRRDGHEAFSTAYSKGSQKAIQGNSTVSLLRRLLQRRDLYPKGNLVRWQRGRDLQRI
jgi:hypothetical protein